MGKRGNYPSQCLPSNDLQLTLTGENNTSLDGFQPKQADYLAFTPKLSWRCVTFTKVTEGLRPECMRNQNLTLLTILDTTILQIITKYKEIKV